MEEKIRSMPRLFQAAYKNGDGGEEGKVFSIELVGRLMAAIGSTKHHLLAKRGVFKTRDR